jgi:hypothetical protein
MLCSTRGSVVLESSEFAPTDVEFVPNNSVFCVSICTSKTSKLRRSIQTDDEFVPNNSAFCVSICTSKTSKLRCSIQTDDEFVPTAAAAPQLLRPEAVPLY